MREVIVTVMFSANGKKMGYDMEIPCNISSKQVVENIVETLNDYNPGLFLNSEGMSITCQRLGRKLDPTESFDMAGIWNGDYIILGN